MGHLVNGKAQLAGTGHSYMNKALFKSCNAAVGQMPHSYIFWPEGATIKVLRMEKKTKDISQVRIFE